MATMRLTGATLNLNGEALSEYATSIELPIETEPPYDVLVGGERAEWLPSRIGALEDTALAFSGFWDGPSLLPDIVDRTITVTFHPRDRKAWRAYYRRHLRPQIGRMRAAYRRKKRGRW